jgi:hypothetical protein
MTGLISWEDKTDVSVHVREDHCRKAIGWNFELAQIEKTLKVSNENYLLPV